MPFTPVIHTKFFARDTANTFLNEKKKMHLGRYNSTRAPSWKAGPVPGVPSLVSRRKMTLKLNYIYMKVL
jgi:hypothetical protein